MGCVRHSHTLASFARMAAMGGTIMNEVLLLADLEKMYKDEWVILVDLIEEPGPRLLGGRVVDHSKDKEEITRKMMELQVERCALRFLGDPPQMDFLLSWPFITGEWS